MVHADTPRPSAAAEPEYWLRGPVAGIVPHLQPVAHALLQAREDIRRVTAGLHTEQLWLRHGRAATAGFHLRHLAGSLDRLCTYARGEQLSDAQRAYLTGEAQPGDPAATTEDLVEAAVASIDQAMSQVAATSEASLLEPRRVGGRQLPSTVLGLLFHAAEHTTRHVGQLITTLRVASKGP
jgi:hypothetical protein